MPSVLETLIVELRGDDGRLRRDLNDAVRASDRAAGSIERRFASLGSSFTRAGRNLTVGITAPLALIGTAAVRSAAQVEVLETSFTTLLGSGERAKGFLEELQGFAASTPFRFPELARSAQSLVAFGIAADETIPTLQRIGDVSAGVGSSVGEIAEIYGKARVQGRLFAEDINQLTGRGIPIIGELASQFGVTESAVRELVSSGAVGFENLEQAFISLTSEGGKFFGLTQAQAETTSGKLSTLQDNIGLLGAEFGEVLLPVVNRAVTGLTNLVRSVNEMDDGTRRLVIGAAAVAAALGPISLGVGALVSTIPNLVRGFGLLNAAFGTVIARAPLVAAGLRSISSAAFGIPGIIAGAAVALGAFVVDSLRAINQLEEATRNAISVGGATDEIREKREELTRLLEDQRLAQQRLTEFEPGTQLFRDFSQGLERINGEIERVSGELRVLREAAEAAAEPISGPSFVVPPIDFSGTLDAAQAVLDASPLEVKLVPLPIPDAVITAANAAARDAIVADTEAAITAARRGRGGTKEATGFVAGAPTPGVRFNDDSGVGRPGGVFVIQDPGVVGRALAEPTVAALQAILRNQRPGAVAPGSGSGGLPDRIVPRPLEPQQLPGLFGGPGGLPLASSPLDGLNVGPGGLALDDGTLYPVIGGAGGGVRAFLSPKGLPGLVPVPIPSIGVADVPDFGSTRTARRTPEGGVIAGNPLARPRGSFVPPVFGDPFKFDPVKPQRGGFLGGFDFDGAKAAQDAAAAFRLEFAQVGASVALSIVDAIQGGEVEDAIGAVFSGAGQVAGLFGPVGQLVGVGLGFIGGLIPRLFGRDETEEGDTNGPAQRLQPPALRLDFTTNQYWTFNGPDPDDARSVNAVTLNDTVREFQRALSAFIPRIERLEAATGVTTPRGVV